MGPWGWQWSDEMRDLVSTPASPGRMTIKTLMDAIEKVNQTRDCVLPITDKERCSALTLDVLDSH
jgi:hypothetical protein